LLLISSAASVTLLGGCSWFSSSSEPKPLGPDQFYRPHENGPAVPAGPQSPAERDPDANPASAPPNVTLVPAPPKPAGNPTIKPAPAEGINFVSDQVQGPKTAEPTTAVAPAKPAPEKTFAPGQFMPIGGVVAEVNGTPIYADNVLRAVAPILVARAKDLDEARFRSLASSEIQRQVEESIRNEVEYAAADRNTTKEEKQTADRLTQQWRDKLVTDNKGSVEAVRKFFRDQGTTFDEAAKEQYRLNLVRVFYAKKLFPRIQVTAEDMRRFYDKNKDTLFTEHDALTFRIIKITPEAMGSDAAAQAKANELEARAQRGEDFAQMAGEINNDPTYLKNRGLVGPIDRGAFRIDVVEKTLWDLPVGGVTPVIHDGDAYYIAKVETKKTGRIAAFEEDAVQKRMLETLRGQQFSRLRADLEAQLRRDSVVARNDQMIATTLDMAMQNYPKWHQ